MSNTGFSNADLTVRYYASDPEIVNDSAPIHVNPAPDTPEFTYIDDTIGLFRLDVSETGLTITFLTDHDFTSVPFTAFEIVDTGGNLVAMQSVATGSATASGFGLTSDADHIMIELTGMTVEQDQTIHLDVTFAAATPPVASDDAVEFDEDQPYEGAVPDADPSVGVHYGLDSPANLYLDFQSDGTYIFDPTETYQHLAAGETATVTFDYHAVGPDGARSDTHTVTITVDGVNDAPEIQPDPVSLTAGLEAGEQVSAFLAGISDVDDNPLQGIAITATGGVGSWQYSTDGAAWNSFTASDGAALLLDANDYIKFTPTGVTTATLTYHAWDETTGQVGGTADLTLAGSTGGTSAFSTGTTTGSVPLDGNNAAPVANPDADFVGENEIKSFDVLANDTDPDPFDQQALLSTGTATVTSANGAVHGIDAADAFAIVGGQIQFDPGTLFDALAAGETATVVVSYAMEDAAHAPSSSTLTLTVNGANDAPTVVADTGTVSENAPDTFAVLANDSDLDTGDSLTLSAIGPVTVTSANLAINGMNADAVFTLVGDEIQFTPGNLFDALAVGESATIVVGYTARDTLDAASFSTLTLTVTGANDAPTAVVDTGSANENQTISFDVVANDVDPDVNDALTLLPLGLVTVSSLNGDINGIDASTAFTIVGGQIQFDPGTLFDALAAGETATVVVSYAMEDAAHAPSSSTLTLTVNGVNDAPTVVADTGTVSENAADSFAVLANDSDLDTGDSLTLSAIGPVTVTSANLAINGMNADAVFTLVGDEIQFTPGNLFDALAVGESATIVVGYTARDTLDAASSSTLTLTVTGANDAPTAVVDTGVADKSQTKDFAVLANDLDPDVNDILSLTTTLGAISVDSTNVSVDGIDARSAFSIVAGAIRFNPGTLFEALTANQSATVVVNYTMEDGQHVSSSSTLTLTVNGATPPPVAGTDTGSAGENQTTAFSVLANDTGYALALDGIDSVSVTSANGTVNGIAAGSAFTIVGNDIQFSPGGLFDGLAVGQSATVVVGYTARDGLDTPASSTLTLTVNGANDNPNAVADTGSATENQTKSFDVVANDTDVDVGDGHSLTGIGTVTVTSANLGVNGIDAASAFTIVGGQLKFAPGTLFDRLDHDDTATAVVTYTTTDSHGATASSSLTLTVNGVNDAPVAVADSASAGENETKSFNVVGNDTDIDTGDAATLTALGTITVAGISGVNAGSAFSIVSGAIRFNPGGVFDGLRAGQSASVTVNYTMKDGQNAAASSALTLTVNGANDAPVAIVDTAFAGYNETKSFNVLANDTDVDSGDSRTLTGLATTITATSTNSAFNGLDVTSAFSISGNQIAFDPGAKFAGLASGETATVVVNYTMHDGSGSAASSALHLTVTGINQAPVIAGGDKAAYAVRENGTAIATVTASDPDAGNQIHFSVAGGADAALFAIDPDTGVLAFVSARDFEAPADADRNNVYQVVVRAADGQDSDTQAIDVTVANIGGVKIVGGRASDTVNAARSVRGQAKPTIEEDAIVGANGSDTLSGLGGNDLINGGNGNDVLLGNAGHDVLIGGWGRNRLAGGPGHDMFVFNSELSNAMGHAYNFSTISDFSVADDTIRLSHLFFKGINPGVLSAAAFFAGAGPHDRSDRIMYNPKNGELIYDRDGSGFVNGVEFGQIAAHLHLSHFDFLIV